MKRLFFFREKKLEIDFSKIQLTTPCMGMHKSFKQAVSEHRRFRTEDFYYPKINSRKRFIEYLNEIKERSSGRNLRAGIVPSTAFWLTDGTHYLGSGDIRHHLNDELMTFGGHIGYSIRPLAQKKGLGTIQLFLLLREANKLGIRTARITCFDENEASIKVIEKNNGVMVGTAYNDIRGVSRKTRIYELPTQSVTVYKQE